MHRYHALDVCVCVSIERELSKQYTPKYLWEKEV